LAFLLNGIQSGVSDLDRGIAINRPVFPPGSAAFHWKLVSIYPTESMLALVQQQQTTLYIAFGIVGILTSLLALYVAHNISNAIVDVTHTSIAIANGNFDRLIGVNRADELGILQKSINSMAFQLKESIQTLEQRVRERTHQLELARQAAWGALERQEGAMGGMHWTAPLHLQKQVARRSPCILWVLHTRPTG
jgi:methyl-accepting chemotaxis protein